MNFGVRYDYLTQSETLCASPVSTQPPSQPIPLIVSFE